MRSAFQSRIIFVFCIHLLVHFSMCSTEGDKEKKENLLKMLDELEEKTKKNDKAENLGKEYGTKLLETTGSRKLLKSGKKVLELNCSPSSLLQSKLKESKSFVWERKPPDMQNFIPIVGVSGSGKLYWAESTDWPKWIKFNEMLSFQSADGNVGQPSTSFLKLYVPLGDCEHEAGSFKCKFYGEEKETGTMKLEKYFMFKDNIDSKCSQGSKVASATRPGPTPDGASSAVDTVGKDVDKVLNAVNPKLSEAKSSYFKIGAVIEAVIIVVLLIVLCCCLRRKNKAGKAEKESKPSLSSEPVAPSAAPAPSVAPAPSAAQVPSAAPAPTAAPMPQQPVAQPAPAPPMDYYSAPPAPVPQPMDAPPPPAPPSGPPNRGALLGDINRFRVE